MASTQTWSEFNGSTCIETTSRAEMNLKNVDDSTTAYSASPITAGSNSFVKHQAVKFGGTWNSLSALTYKVNANSQQAGAISIVGAVESTYATPATSASGDSAMSTSGLSASFGTSSFTTGASPTTGPFSTGGGSSSTAGGTLYLNALRLQLQTTGGAAPGDITSTTITCSWTES